MAATVSIAFAQAKTVSGTVKDDKGAAAAFVTVVEKGTSNATTTNDNGFYALKVAGNDAILMFKSVGFKDKEVAVGANSSVNVALENNAKVLGQVTVTALGIAISKDKTGSAQSSVGGAAITNSGETNVLAGLSSKASGVQIQRSGGDPGAGSYIQIRGQNTIFGNNQPLFIIDGVPVSNSSTGTSTNQTDGVAQQSRLNDINPNDIADIQILKGVAATALWGTRAANGVIIIKTKGGTKSVSSKFNVSFATTVSFDQLNRTVPLQTKFGQGAKGIYRYGNRTTYGDKIADRKGGDDVQVTAPGQFYYVDGDGVNVDLYNGFVTLPNGEKRYVIPSQKVADRVTGGLTPVFDAAGNPLGIHGGKNSTTTYDHGTDLFKTGFYIDNNISMSGGDQKSTFFLSAGRLSQQGILKVGSDYERYNLRFNADRQMSERIKLSANIAYSNSNSNRVQQGSNLSGIFLGGLRTPGDFDNTYYQGAYTNKSGQISENSQIAYRNPIGASIFSVYDNPNWVINNIKNKSKVNRVIGGLEGNFKLAENLSFVLRPGVDFSSDKRIEYLPFAASAAPAQGKLTYRQIQETQFNNDAFLRYGKSFTEKFAFSAILGTNYNQRLTEDFSLAVQDYVLAENSNFTFNLANSSKSNRTPTNSEVGIGSGAVYSQVDFDLAQQLYLTVTGRAEKVSTLKDIFFYPSASLAWQFTKPLGLTENDVLSFGKIRLSAGQVGVQPQPYLDRNYFFPQVLTEGWGSGFDATSAIYGGGYSRNTTFGNPNLKPERKSEFEIGTDIRLFKDKVSFSYTYYDNTTKDALLPTPVGGSQGYTSIWSNAATLNNKGHEVDLGISWFNKNDIKFSTNIIWSQNKNIVKSLNGTKSLFLNGFTSSGSRAVEGQPLGAIWGEKWERTESGSLALDAAGFPKKALDEGVVGNPNPDWIGSISNTISYKGARLSFMFDHVEGGDVWNGTRGALRVFGTSEETGEETTLSAPIKNYAGKSFAAGETVRGVVKNWGGNDVLLDESWYTSLGGGFVGPAEQFIEKGTRTRLREVSLGYTFSTEKFRKASGLQSIDLSISGRNLYLWTNYKGIDPETNLTGPSNGRGLDYFNNPSTRSYFFTVKINY
jgi:TonB-linked SusC/RagA family outer membrane protein